MPRATESPIRWRGPAAGVDAIAAAAGRPSIRRDQATERYALLFKPGGIRQRRYPLNFQVGYYTEVAGLGRSPGNVVINGLVDVRNQCLSPDRLRR